MALDPKDFTLTWEPVQPSGAQWCVATHGPTKRSMRLKAALCVRKAEKDLDLWARTTAAAILDRTLYEESAAGVKAAKLAEANAAADDARRAAERIAVVKATYPLEKLPTVTVTAAQVGEI